MMAGPDDLDVEKLRVDPEFEQQARKSKRKGWQRLCTVVPRAWELRLLEAKRVSTYRLAIELLYLHWYGKGNPIAVTGKVAEATRLSDRSKSRALAELERLGLIEIDRSPRKSPRVALHHVPAK
jgi:DNA-binding transcriptional ArsR family regulator